MSYNKQRSYTIYQKSFEGYSSYSSKKCSQSSVKLMKKWLAKLKSYLSFSTLICLVILWHFHSQGSYRSEPSEFEGEVEDDLQLTTEPIDKKVNVTCKNNTAQNDDVPLENNQITKKPYCDDLFKEQILDNEATKIRITLDIETLKENAKQLDRLVQSTGITKGGCWSPQKYCIVRQKIAVIVPYRDRSNHMNIFLYYMHTFLQKQHREYCLVIVEQQDKGQFNRGKLFNIGYDLVSKQACSPCFSKR